VTVSAGLVASPVGFFESNGLPRMTVIETNATTARIQSAFNAGGIIWFRPSLYPYVMTTNVAITNAVYVIGNNALIRAASGVTNAVWDTGTNTAAGRILIEDVRFDGQVRSNFSGATPYAALVNGTPTLYYNPYWSNLTALRVSSSSGGAVRGCEFFGWPGNGLLVVNPNAASAQNYSRIEVVANRAYSNMCGIFLAGATYETAGYYNNSAPWQLASAEYQSVRGNQFFRNYMGLAGGAANAQVQNNFFTGNQVGFHQGSAPNNGGHGLVENNTFNHNIIGAWAESCQLGQWKQNNFLANSSAGFLGGSITEILFHHNYLGTDKVIITNVSTGVVRDNDYQGAWGSIGWVITNTVRVFGNTSLTVAGDNDGSPHFNRGGLVIPMLTAVPTNAILASSAAGTNWTQCNINGLIFRLATNYAAAGSFMKEVGGTVSAYP
jgi:hypothetical protein